jgi:tRNA (guanine37-N1)-methyltransferase
MKITLLSLFPQIIEGYFTQSIAKRAITKEALAYHNVNIRDYAEDKHKKCDDHPFGGGAGMVLKAEPLAKAIEAHQSEKSYVVYPTPSGKPFDQSCAQRLSQHDELIFICGRYEGIDQRIIDVYVDEELSIGNYVMASGELSSLVIVDSIMRLLDGVINKESLSEESFSNGLLEYPHYTRPEEWRGHKVPKVLLQGNHAKIKEWRLEKSKAKTLANNGKIVHNK